MYSNCQWQCKGTLCLGRRLSGMATVGSPGPLGAWRLEYVLSGGMLRPTNGQGIRLVVYMGKVYWPILGARGLYPKT